MNTLKHYGLTDGAVVALVAKQTTLSSTASSYCSNSLSSRNGFSRLPRHTGMSIYTPVFWRIAQIAISLSSDSIEIRTMTSRSSLRITHSCFFHEFYNVRTCCKIEVVDEGAAALKSLVYQTSFSESVRTRFVSDGLHLLRVCLAFYLFGVIESIGLTVSVVINGV